MSKSADTTVKTARLMLRGPRPTDLDALYAVYGSATAMRYWSTPPHATRAITGVRLENQMRNFATLPSYFIIEEGRDIIGNAGMNSDGEVGFILRPDRWRQGFAREAMLALLPHLWRITDRARLTADADPNNAGSIALLRALGFQETHRATNTFCLNGIWADSVYFALDRPVCG